ncbi:MAG: molybdopterin molybdotransferase MoeA [Bacteroidales bacterium]|nr:molybdopterin molybdotransferase MoeA [Bacteroidales bacterium]
MITFEEALEIVEKAAIEAEIEQVDFTVSTDRILARDVHSDVDMPPFDKSAVDGFACRKEDIRAELAIIETIPAGKYPQKAVGKGQCSRIMTGAPVPEGADTVLMVEDIEYTEEERIRYLKESSKSNICYRGEDVTGGARVLTKGTRIKPQHIAVLASVGCVSPWVYRRVRCGIISTGDEIVEPGRKPVQSQIRNSNSYQLLAQAQKAGAEATYYGIAADNEEGTATLVRKALSENDVALLTGGVSMGDFDFVPKALEDLGVEILFKSIAVQPGRPTVFGRKENRYVFGLPGNPVSSFVQFELLVKPLLYKLQGARYSPVPVFLPMGKEYRRKKSSRLSVLPVRINEKGEVMPLEFHGSAHLNALTEADGLILVETGKTLVEKGSIVHVRQI